MGRFIAMLAGVLLLGAGVLGAGASGGNAVPLPDGVVLFGEQQITTQRGVNVLSGDTATNQQAIIGQESTLQGSLLADRAVLQRDVAILANLEANRITGPAFTVQGETITPRETPDYEIPELPTSSPGTERIRIGRDETVTISPGSYSNIAIGDGATVTLEPGDYHIRRLHIDRDATLILGGATTISVHNHLHIGADTVFDADPDLPPSDIRINFFGHGTSIIGIRTFGLGTIHAPDGGIHLSRDSIWRGQLAAKRVSIGQDAILSRQAAFVKPSNPNKVVNDEGDIFAVDEVGVLFVDGVTFQQVEEVRALIDGRIVGFVPVPQMRLFQIAAETAADTDLAISEIENANFPFVEVAFRNSVAAIIE